MMFIDLEYYPNKFYCIVKALMMVLGFTHEINRLDRNTFVAINEDNISEDDIENFEIIEYVDEHEHTLGLPYDLLSLLHFKWNEFAMRDNEPTIFIV